MLCSLIDGGSPDIPGLIKPEIIQGSTVANLIIEYAVNSWHDINCENICTSAPNMNIRTTINLAAFFPEEANHFCNLLSY